MTSVNGTNEDGVVRQSVHRRARGAVRLLLGRQAVLQVLAVAGGIVVARVLGPGPIGVFGIALFVVNIAGVVADSGTRTALIRQAEGVTDRQLAACLALQQVLVTFLVAILLVTAPVIASLYTRAPAELASLLRLLALDLYLRSWRSMSEIRLERELRYRPLATSDIAGSAAYQLTAVLLVLSGVGAHALALAMIAGNVVRVSLLFRIAPWPIRVVFSRSEVVPLVRAGLPVQLNHVVTQMPGWITPTLVAGLVGPEAVGFLTWAASLGRKPREVLENVIRVSIPHFARLQFHVDEVERVLARYVALALLTCALWVAVVIVAGHDLVALIYTERWLPAVPALMIYALSTPLASIRGLASAALIGIGRARHAAHAGTVIAVVSVLASIILVLEIGFLGVPIGQLVGLLLVTPWLLSGVGPGVAGRVLRTSSLVLGPLAAGLAGGLLVHLLPVPVEVRGVAVGAVAALLFVLTAWYVGPPWLRITVRGEAAALRRVATRIPRAAGSRRVLH